MSRLSYDGIKRRSRVTRMCLRYKATIEEGARGNDVEENMPSCTWTAYLCTKQQRCNKTSKAH